MLFEAGGCEFRFQGFRLLSLGLRGFMGFQYSSAPPYAPSLPDNSVGPTKRDPQLLKSSPRVFPEHAGEAILEKLRFVGFRFWFKVQGLGTMCRA